jgi:hypothetical protein
MVWSVRAIYPNPAGAASDLQRLFPDLNARRFPPNHTSAPDEPACYKSGVMTQDSPAMLVLDASRLEDDPALAKLISDIRQGADMFVFLSGGAGGMSAAIQRRLVMLLEAIVLLARRGRRIAVGDGGTHAGLMEAAGLAREASDGRFLLVGVSPAPAVTDAGEEGKTPVDRNHSHIVAVYDRDWETARREDGWTPEDGYWGSETRAMYRIFARLAEGRPSATLVANGGSIVLEEVRRTVEAGRQMILVAGSGRAADALVSLVSGTEPAEDEVKRLRDRARAMGLPGPRALYHQFDLSGSPEELARVLDGILSRA